MLVSEEVHAVLFISRVVGLSAAPASVLGGAVIEPAVLALFLSVVEADPRSEIAAEVGFAKEVVVLLDAVDSRELHASRSARSGGRGVRLLLSSEEVLVAFVVEVVSILMWTSRKACRSKCAVQFKQLGIVPLVQFQAVVLMPNEVMGIVDALKAHILSTCRSNVKRGVLMKQRRILHGVQVQKIVAMSQILPGVVKASQ